MSLPLFLDAVLVAAIVGLVAFVINTTLKLNKTLNSADELLRNLNDQVEPISKNLVSSLEKVDGDLGRISEVVRSLEEMSNRVQSTMEVAREAIASPLVKVASFSAGTREAFKKFISRD
ncbi:MAG: DUF948 domain-containing protein [Candidatus Aquicultorales bacterium]